MLSWTSHPRGEPEGGIAAVVAVGHKVYSFGTERNSDQIEVRVFNTAPLRWMKLPEVTTRSGEFHPWVPSGCWSYTAVLIGDDIIYIWGGYWRREYSNVLDTFDVDTHRWFKPKISGSVPEGRESHSACVLGKAMYIYEGFNRLTGCTNEFYKLDTSKMVWSLINTGGPPPPASCQHSATIIGTKMFVFGGWENGRHALNGAYHNNMRVFDTETNCWLSTPASQIGHETGWDHLAFAYNGEMYVNLLSTSYRPQMWKLNPETFSWKKVEPKGKGPWYWTPGISCCAVGDRIILFQRHMPHGLYVLDMSPSLKTLCKLAVIQYGLEQLELPHNIRWELAAMTKETRARFTLSAKRSSPPGSL